MAAFRRGTSYFSLIRTSASVLFRALNPAARKPNRWTKFLTSSVASLAVGGSLCAVPFKEAENLSHEALIRHAASVATSSSNSFLTQTTVALLDSITEYAKAVHTLIALQKQYLDALGKLTPAQEDSVWQVIIGQRAKVSDCQGQVQHYELVWLTALKLSEMAAEAAYASGADHAAVVSRTHIELAKSQVEETQKLSSDADKKLTETKVMEVERMGQYSASLDENNEGEEVPEAYLRED